MEKFNCDIGKCARCGKDHKGLLFIPFTDPPEGHTHFGTCPETSEPILMKQTDGSARSEAWSLGNKDSVPFSASLDGRNMEFYTARVGLGLYAKRKAGERMPEVPFLPSFWIAFTDLDAFKRELCAQADTIFDAFHRPPPDIP